MYFTIVENQGTRHYKLLHKTVSRATQGGNPLNISWRPLIVSLKTTKECNVISKKVSGEQAEFCPYIRSRMRDNVEMNKARELGVHLKARSEVKCDMKTNMWCNRSRKCWRASCTTSIFCSANQPLINQGVISSS